MTITLRSAELSDIPFIMACERRPEYERFVGRWPEEKHRAVFLQLLEQTAHKFGFEVRGVAVLPDRFHLLMTEPEKDTAHPVADSWAAFVEGIARAPQRAAPRCAVQSGATGCRTCS